MTLPDPKRQLHNGPFGPGRHWPFDEKDETRCTICGTLLTSVTQLREPCPGPVGGCDLAELRLAAATRAVELLAEKYPWMDTQGLGGDDFEIVAREVLHAAFPSEPAWITKTSGGE